MRSVGFSGEINRGIHYLGSEKNDIINQYLGKPKGGQFQSLLFSLILQPVRINKPGAPLLGLAKFIYYRFILNKVFHSHPRFTNSGVIKSIHIQNLYLYSRFTIIFLLTINFQICIQDVISFHDFYIHSYSYKTFLFIW